MKRTEMYKALEERLQEKILNTIDEMALIQIPNREERNTVVDYIREGIFDREWRKYVNAVETGD